MPRWASYLSGPRPSICCPLSEFGRILQAQDNRAFAHTLLQLGPVRHQMSCHSTASLSRNRYVAMVLLQPLHDVGMLAAGLPENRSMIVLARLSRRHPKAKVDKFHVRPMRIFQCPLTHDHAPRFGSDSPPLPRHPYPCSGRWSFQRPRTDGSDRRHAEHRLHRRVLLQRPSVKSKDGFSSTHR
jgi:hypothetical protein